jgi:secretion/DNA translocation related TadE-like protein
MAPPVAAAGWVPVPPAARPRAASSSAADDRGSASLWVLAGGVLVLLVAFVAVARGSAVLARERAEAAADLAALAAADGIGVDGSTASLCHRAAGIARQNGARVRSCSVRLGADGRTGTVDVTVTVGARLAGVGDVQVSASSRAGRLAWGSVVRGHADVVPGREGRRERGNDGPRTA